MFFRIPFFVSLLLALPVFAKENMELAAEFKKLVRKSEAMQRLPTSDSRLSELYWLDKTLAKSCPSGAEKITCARYLRANPNRFWEGDGFGPRSTAFWLRQQKVPDPKAHGDFELDSLALQLGAMLEDHGSTDQELDSLKFEISRWKEKNTSHFRLLDADKLQADIDAEKAMHSPASSK